MDWHRVAALADLRDGEAMAVQLMGLQLARYNVQGEWFAPTT